MATEAITDSMYFDNQYPLEQPEKQSKFSAAFPWGASMLTLAGGSLYALSSASVAIKVAAVAGTLFGAYGFLTVVATAVNSRNGKEFSDNIKKNLTVAGAAIIAEMIAQVAKEVLRQLIRDAFGNKS